MLCHICVVFGFFLSIKHSQGCVACDTFIWLVVCDFVLSKEIFAVDVVLRAISDGSVRPGRVSTDVSRSTKARVIRILSREGYLDQLSQGLYKAGPNIKLVLGPGTKLSEETEGEDAQSEEEEISPTMAMYGSRERLDEFRKRKQEERAGRGSSNE